MKTISRRSLLNILDGYANSLESDYYECRSMAGQESVATEMLVVDEIKKCLTSDEEIYVSHDLELT